MKKGQWVVRYEPESDERPILSMQRKGSNGTYKEENINAYTERMIQDAKRMTEHLSAKADEEIKEYLFLNKSFLRKIRVIEQDAFYRRFKRIISEFPLKGGPYTVYNLRDTFMTNIFIQGKKDGKSISEIHPATGHADMRTGVKHYRGHKIKSFLEAFHGIIIGNVNIKGIIATDLRDVVKELPKNIDSITVKDKCGFCKQNGCPLTKEIDCLICTSFITTIDRIPFFKKKIALLDEKICEELIEHEKEHLKLIKRLCLGYLAKLMELEVNISGSH